MRRAAVATAVVKLEICEGEILKHSLYRAESADLDQGDAAKVRLLQMLNRFNSMHLALIELAESDVWIPAPPGVCEAVLFNHLPLHSRHVGCDLRNITVPKRGAGYKCLFVQCDQFWCLWCEPEQPASSEDSHRRKRSLKAPILPSDLPNLDDALRKVILGDLQVQKAKVWQVPNLASDGLIEFPSGILTETCVISRQINGAVIQTGVKKKNDPEMRTASQC